MTPLKAPLRARTAWALYALVASLYLLTTSGRIGGGTSWRCLKSAHS